MTCPGIKVENFSAINSFLIVIKFEPNPVSVLNDVPIDLSQNSKFLPDYNNIIFNDKRFDTTDSYKNSANLLNQYDDYFKNIKDKLNDLQNQVKNNLNPETSPDQYDCPIDDIDPDELLKEIKQGKQPNLVTTENLVATKPENFDLNNSTVSYCNENDQLNLIDLIKIPDINQGVYHPPKPPQNLACLFNDDKLKNVATYIEKNLLDKDNTPLKDVNNLLDNAFKDTQDNINDTLKKNGIDVEKASEELHAAIPANIPTEDILKNKYNLNFKLGIPLVTLDCKNQIYLQILNKKLQVTNLIDFSGEYLEIDKEMDLDAPGYVGFYTNGFKHQLFYYDGKNGKMYNDEINIKKNLSIGYIGIDDQFRKHYCGLVYDIQILLFKKHNFLNAIQKDFKFKIPTGVLYYYDWHKDRIKYNLIFPLPDLTPPVKMYSAGGYTNYILHTEKDPYHFMENGYLTQFFCWRVLTKNDFSIGFWFNKSLQNNVTDSDYSCLVYDERNDYGLYYNDYSKKFKIDLNGSKTGISKTFDFLVEDNLWYFCNFKYSSEENKLYFNIRNIDQDDFNDFKEFIIDLSKFKDFEFGKFILSSMLAKKAGTFYNQQFICKFGTLALFDSKREHAEEFDQFTKERMVIKVLDL